MSHKMAAEMEEQEGDSSKNLLANYQRSAREVLRSALSEQHCGTIHQHNEHLKQTNLCRKKEKLLNKQLEAAVQLELRQRLSDEPLGSVSVSEDEGYVDSVRQRVKILENELLGVKCEHQKNCQLLECLHRGRVMRERLVTERGVGVADEHLAKQVELSRELLSDVEEVERMKSELMKLRRERVKIQQQSRVLMKSLQAPKLPQPGRHDCCGDTSEDNIGSGTNSSDNDISSRLVKAEKEVCLLCHALQGLVSGSGVDWNQDKELLQLTLKLGDDEQWR